MQRAFFLASAKREQATDWGTAPTDGPATLIAVNRVAWLRADYGVMRCNARVDAWKSVWGTDKAVRVSNGNTLTFEAAGLGGKPSMVSASNRLRMTFETPIAAGSTAYVWVVAQPTSTATGQTVANIYTDTSNSIIVLCGSTKFQVTRADSSGAAAQDLSSLTKDTVVHVFAFGFTAGGTAGLSIGAVDTNTTRTGTPTVPLTDLYICGANNGGSSVRVAEVVVVSAEPDATLKANMMSYFNTRYGV